MLLSFSCGVPVIDNLSLHMSRDCSKVASHIRSLLSYCLLSTRSFASLVYKVAYIYTSYSILQSVRAVSLLVSWVVDRFIQGQAREYELRPSLMSVSWQLFLVSGSDSCQLQRWHIARMSGVVPAMRIQHLCLAWLLSKRERRKTLQRRSAREMMLRYREQQ